MNDEQIITKIATLEAKVSNLENSDIELKEAIGRLVDKIDKLLLWMIGLMGTTLASIFVALVK